MHIYSLFYKEENMSISTIGSSLLSRSRPTINIRNSSLSSAAPQDKIGSAQLNSPQVDKKELPSPLSVSETELEHKAYLTYLQKYIKSFGAPEELERHRIIDDSKPGDDEDELKRKAGRNFNPNALETLSQTVQDPENDEEIKVVVSKVDEKGEAKITRIMNFDTGGDKEEGKQEVGKSEMDRHKDSATHNELDDEEDNDFS